MKTSEPKYIYRRLHECADGIAISESDLENVNNIDEFYENLMTEVMPVLLDQIGNLKTLREKLRHAEYGE